MHYFAGFYFREKKEPIEFVGFSMGFEEMLYYLAEKGAPLRSRYYTSVFNIFRERKIVSQHFSQLQKKQFYISSKSSIVNTLQR